MSLKNFRIYIGPYAKVYSQISTSHHSPAAAQIAAHNGGKIGFARDTLLARYSKIWGARNVETGVDHHQ
jgi:hypothetical protein